VPDLFYQLLLVVLSAANRIFGCVTRKQTREEGWRSVSIFMNVAAVVMILAVVIGELLAPWLIGIFTARLVAETTALAVVRVHVRFPASFLLRWLKFVLVFLTNTANFIYSFGPSVYYVCCCSCYGYYRSQNSSGSVRVALVLWPQRPVYFFLQLLWHAVNSDIILCIRSVDRDLKAPALGRSTLCQDPLFSLIRYFYKMRSVPGRADIAAPCSYYLGMPMRFCHRDRKLCCILWPDCMRS
jgi:hypothetical protein